MPTGRPGACTRCRPTIDDAGVICTGMELNISEDQPYIVLFSTPLIDAWRSTIAFPITDVLGGINQFPNAWLGQVGLCE